MKTIAGIAFVLFGLVGVGESQVKRQPSRFEVVSIKPCANSAAGSPSSSPTRLRLNCVTVEDLILQAYIAFPNGVSLPKGVSGRDVELDAGASVQNAPSWVRSKRFTIDAIANVPSSSAEKLGPLMQTVLKDRFQLRLHEDSRPMQVYELIQSPRGAKLQPAKEGNCIEMDATKQPPRFSGGRPPIVCGGCARLDAESVDCFHTTTDYLSRLLSYELQKPVVNKTVLAGLYDVHLDVSIDKLASSWLFLYRQQPGDWGNPDTSAPGGSVLASMRGLGLQVRSAKGTAKVLVVERIELPSGN